MSLSPGDGVCSGVCSSCRMPFDKSRKRRLIDSCGHERCYSCIFRNDICPLCLETGEWLPGISLACAHCSAAHLLLTPHVAGSSPNKFSKVRDKTMSVSSLTETSSSNKEHCKRQEPPKGILNLSWVTRDVQMTGRHGGNEAVFYILTTRASPDKVNTF